MAVSKGRTAKSQVRQSARKLVYSLSTVAILGTSLECTYYLYVGEIFAVRRRLNALFARWSRNRTWQTESPVTPAAPSVPTRATHPIQG